MTESSTGSVRPAKLIALVSAIGGLAILAIVTLSPNGATRVFMWPWWLLWRIALLVPAALLLIRSVTSPDRGQLPSIALLSLLLAAIHFVSAAAGSLPFESLSYACAIAAPACLVALLATAPAAWPLVPHVLAWSGVVYSAWSLVYWLGNGGLSILTETHRLNALAGEALFRVNPHAFRNPFMLGHVNYTAGLCLITLPWVVVCACRARGWRRWAWATASAGVLACLLSSGSRGGLLGLAAATVTTVLLYARVHRWSPRRAALALAAAASVCLAVVAASPRIRESLANAVSRRTTDAGDEQRLGMLAVGLRMGADRWWIGQGPGLTPRVYPHFRGQVDLGIESAFQLHSTPLQIWADTGAPGLLAASALLFVVLAATWRTAMARRHESPDARAAPEPWIGLTAGVALVGYGTLALTDYQLDVAAIGAALAGNLGLLAACQRRHRPVTAPGHLARFGPAFAGAITVLILAFTGALEGRARSALSSAVTALERSGDFSAFDAGVNSAAAWLPHNPHFDVAGAAAHMRFSYAATTPEQRAAHEAAAIGFLRGALAAEPNLEFAHFNLGWLQLGRSPADAALHFRAAQNLVPDRNGVYLGLALARLEEGDEARGVEALGLELLSDPRFATSPAWDTPFLAAHRSASLRRASALADELGARCRAEFRERFRYLSLLFRWLEGDTLSLSDLPSAAPARARAFFRTKPADVTGPRTLTVRPETPGCEVLEAALANPRDRRALLAKFVLARSRSQATAGVLDALERLLDSCGTNWRCWLLSEAGRNPPFTRVERRDRRAYSVLAYNMDIPTPVDSFVVQQSLLAEWFFDGLFPYRGHLPESLLVTYVAERDL